MIRVLCVVFAIFTQSPLALSATPLDARSLERLSGLTIARLSEFQAMSEIASEANSRVVAYGGTAREIVDYVRDRVATLGSVEAYEEWLKTQREISIVDWHRLQSDLDIMLVPNEGSDVPLSADRWQKIDVARKKIDARFPQSVFYKRIDLIIPQEFFAKYPIAQEHFEPISSMSLSDRGLERLPQLNIEIGGEKIHLGEEGLRQISKGRLDFRLNPTVGAPNGSDSVFSLFRQTLRWIRYLSEYPSYEVSAETERSIRSVLAQITEPNASAVIQLLKEGSEDYKPGRPSFGNGAKIIEQLEKLQLYSRNSQNTASLLEKFGIKRLASAAGIADARIFEPLPARSTPIANGARRLGKEIVLRHRTSLNAAQNISRGALWISNDKAIIGGSATGAAHGPGLYAAPAFESLSYGDHFVSITLSADAVEGVDFKRNGEWYVLMTENAIARDPSGGLKIDRVKQRDLLDNLMSSLDDPNLTSANRFSVLRATSGLLNPETSAADLKTFKEIYADAKRRGIGGEMLASLLNRPHLGSHLATSNSQLRSWILGEIKGGLETGLISTGQIRVNIANLLLAPDASDQLIRDLPMAQRRSFLALVSQMGESEKLGFRSRIEQVATDSDPTLRFYAEVAKNPNGIYGKMDFESAAALAVRIDDPDKETLNYILNMSEAQRMRGGEAHAIDRYLYRFIDRIDDPIKALRMAMRAGELRPDLAIAIDAGNRAQARYFSLAIREGEGSGIAKKLADTLLASSDPKSKARAISVAVARKNVGDLDLAKLNSDFDFDLISRDDLDGLLEAFRRQPIAAAKQARALRGLLEKNLSPNSTEAWRLRKEVVRTIAAGGVATLRALSPNGEGIENIVMELIEREAPDAGTNELLLGWLQKTKDPKLQKAIFHYYWRSVMKFGRATAFENEVLLQIAKNLAENSDDWGVRDEAFHVLSYTYRHRPDILEFAVRMAPRETDYRVAQAIYGTIQGAVRERPWGSYDFDLAVAGFKALEANPAVEKRNPRYMLDELESERAYQQGKLDKQREIDEMARAVRAKSVSPTFEVVGPVAEPVRVIQVDSSSSGKAAAVIPNIDTSPNGILDTCVKFYERLFQKKRRALNP